MAESPLLTIDGSYGEGGGQLLRSALALSILTNCPFRMVNVRARRSPSGLRPQHLAALRAMAYISGASVRGAEIGSREILFEPGPGVKGGTYTFDITTLSGRQSAGSTTLILQTLLLPLALLGDRPSQITLKGGTHVRGSPCYHYLAEVYLPMLEHIGIRCHVELGPWGWHPEGNGELYATIEPVERNALKGLQCIQRGRLQEIWGLSAASNLPRHIIERQAAQLEKHLRARHIKAEILLLAPSSPGKGTVVFLLAQYENAPAGFTGYGRLHYPAERVADDAFEAFDAHRRRGGAFDPYLADQLVLPLTLARGTSTYTTSCVTPHLTSVAWLAQQFTERTIEIQGEIGQQGQVTIS